MNVRSVNAPLLAAVIILTVAIPKSGFYVASVPIYGIYMLILLTLPFLLLREIGHRRDRRSLLYLYLLCPFWVVWLATALSIGYESVAYLGGHLFVFLLVPVFFFLLGNSQEARSLKTLETTLRLSMNFVAAFGLVSFVHTLQSGDYLNLPYLTTAGGGGPLDVWQRNNQRGDLFKLVSTYNNGNIYGLCIATLTPLYFQLQRSRLWRCVLLASLVLTLSRTVWLLTLLSLLLIYGQRLNLKKLLGIAVLGLISVGAMLYLAQFLGGNDFLLDGSLGNRNKFFWMVDDLKFLPSEKIGAITEIPYLSIYYRFGLLGLLTFALFICAPLFIGNPSPFSRRLDATQRAINSGIVLYLFASLSDSALLFVPSYACYSLLIFLKLSKPSPCPNLSPNNAPSGFCMSPKP